MDEDDRKFLVVKPDCLNVTNIEQENLRSLDASRMTYLEIIFVFIHLKDIRYRERKEKEKHKQVEH